MELSYTPFNWDNWKKKPYHPSIDEIKGMRFEIAKDSLTPEITIKSEGVYRLPLVTKFLPADNNTEKARKKKNRKEKRWLRRKLYSSMEDIRRRSRDEPGEVVKYSED